MPRVFPFKSCSTLKPSIHFWSSQKAGNGSETDATPPSFRRQTGKRPPSPPPPKPSPKTTTQPPTSNQPLDFHLLEPPRKDTKVINFLQNQQMNMNNMFISANGSRKWLLQDLLRHHHVRPLETLPTRCQLHLHRPRPDARHAPRDPLTVHRNLRLLERRENETKFICVDIHGYICIMYIYIYILCIHVSIQSVLF